MVRCAVLCCDVLCVPPVGRYLLCNSVCGGRWTLRQPASATAHLGLALLALALAFALRAALDSDLGASAAQHVYLQHACMLCCAWVRALKCGSEAGTWPRCRFASLRVARHGGGR
jgi:hypothetical protein